MIIMPQVVDKIPPTPTRLHLPDVRQLPFVKGLRLSDPKYASLAKRDLLLDVESSHACHTDDIRRGSMPGLKALDTIFGWTLSGGTTVELTPERQSAPGICMRVYPKEDAVQIFRDLLALEDDSDSELTKDEQTAMQHFADNVRRDEGGRYYVSLPRRHPLMKLGKSREAAYGRYLNNERSLLSKGEWESFSAAVDNYFEWNHAEEVPEADLRKPAAETFYLPMHGVLKESSTSTKLCVVFDASAKTTSGLSLNDTLLPGPALHPLLPSVLTSFRSFEFAITADVSKMFRGIGLNAEEFDYHRYLHCRPDGAIREMRHTRLTFE